MPHPVLTNGGTSAEWALENPILPANMTGTETDTSRTKIGNGSSYWNSLKYTDEPSGPDILALAVSNAINESDKDVNIGVDSSHNWGEQTAVEAGKGMHWFDNIKSFGYSDGEYIELPHKPIRKEPIRIGLFGDSTATTGTYTVNDNCEVIDYVFPASGTTSSSVTSSRYMTFLNYPAVMLCRNAGIANQTTSDMLARDNLVASATRKAATDLANANLDCIIFRGGSINNFGEGIFTQQEIDDRVDLHKQVLARLRATGAAIIDEGIAGYLLAPGTTAQMGKLAAIQIFNAAIKDYIRSLNDPTVIFLNPVGVTCAESGIWLPGLSSDGVHCEPRGQYELSKAEKLALTELFGPSAKIRYPGTNLSPNPMLANTAADGAGRGTVATGFSFPADSVKRKFTNLSVDMLDDVPMQSGTYTPLGVDTQTGIITLPLALSDLNITSGDIIGVEFDIWVRKVDGTPLPNGSTLNCIFSLRKTGNGTIQNTPYSLITQGDMPEFKGHVVLNKLKINEDQASLDLLTFTTTYSPELGVGTLVGQDVRISIGGVRVVKQ